MIKLEWMSDSLVLGIICIACFIAGFYMVWIWLKNDIAVLQALQKSDKWETPKDFRKRTGSDLPREAAVYCRWKKDGPMYKKLKTLKELYESNIAKDPDEWAVHTYSTALSLGNVHGEQMEILCADNDMGCPPPAYQNSVINVMENGD
jgi:hypothetical protein